MTDDKTGDDVTVKIRTTLSLAIAEGALLPGMKILDDVIARHFGVSRTVARGAVAILEHERLIERRRNHGAFVVAPSAEEARDLLEARRAVELAIVGRAVGTLTATDLARLDAITRDEEAIHSGADSVAKKRIAGNFHVELAQAAGNAVLTDVLRNLVARLSLVAALYETRTATCCGSHDHRAIIEAIARRDPEAARLRMLAHLGAIEDTLDLGARGDDMASLSSVLAKFAPPSAPRADRTPRAAVGPPPDRAAAGKGKRAAR
jgi:DNA-binding GntR family transcriptional regulator